jgi:hypothetical protein
MAAKKSKTVALPVEEAAPAAPVVEAAPPAPAAPVVRKAPMSVKDYVKQQEAAKLAQ